MSDLYLRAEFDLQQSNIKIELTVIEFIEDDVFILYAPALDITGYGYTEVEAKDSFKETLEEFFRYTINKGTISAALKKLGWSVIGSKNNKKFREPLSTKLIAKNPFYSSIINSKKNYNVKSESIEYAF